MAARSWQRGEGVAEKLVEWYDPEKAAAFVKWLNERLPLKPSMPISGNLSAMRVE